MKRRRTLSIYFLFLTLVVSSSSVASGRTSDKIFRPTTSVWQSQKFIRTELYFGTDKPDGTKVAPEEWNKFLAEEVTARFPEGFTILEGYGQFKDAKGAIVREQSKVLILFYPKNTRAAVNQKIEEIRSAYKTRFQQESVLRLDFQKAVRVQF